MVDVPNVQRVKRPNGRVDLYFRKGSHRRPLVNADGTAELLAEVEAILKEIAGVEQAKKPRPGTVPAMLAIYNRSADFLALSRRVQSQYQRMLDEMKVDMEDVLLGDVTAAWVREMRDAWAARGYRAANIRLQVLANALGPAIEDQLIPTDPFARLRKVRRPHELGEAHPIWEEAEYEAAVEDAIATGKPGLARVYALARFGGFRKSTCRALPRNALSKQGRLFWITEKRKVLCNKRADPRLVALIKRTADKATLMAYDADGHAWKDRALGHAVTRHIARLAKKGLVREGLDLHGLRHTRGVELAEGGASDAEIMAQLEHATDRAAKIYRRQAERRKLADAAQDRLDNVTELPVSPIKVTATAEGV